VVQMWVVDGRILQLHADGTGEPRVGTVATLLCWATQECCVCASAVDGGCALLGASCSCTRIAGERGDVVPYPPGCCLPVFLPACRPACLPRPCSWLAGWPPTCMPACPADPTPLAHAFAHAGGAACAPGAVSTARWYAAGRQDLGTFTFSTGGLLPDTSACSVEPDPLPPRWGANGRCYC